MYTTRLPAALLVLSQALLAGPLVSVAHESTTVVAGAASRAVGAGRWESSRDASGKRDWQIEIERFEDNSVGGSIVVIGSAYLRKARIEGRVDGSDVYGVLIGDNNNQVGTFTGTISDSELSGRYTTIQGDSGTWSWSGPAAARSLGTDRSEKTSGAE